MVTKFFNNHRGCNVYIILLSIVLSLKIPNTIQHFHSSSDIKSLYEVIHTVQIFNYVTHNTYRCCCCIDYSVLYWLEMLYNYKMWMKIFGTSSTPWHPMVKSALDVRPAFPLELTHYYLTIAWVWQVSYFNSP